MENGIIKNNAVDLWKQPGGGLAKFGLWVMGAGLGVGLYILLPFLITLAQNMLFLALLLGGLGAVLWILFNSNTRKMFKLGYLQICRMITGFFVEIDPIAILENSIKEMKEKLVKVNGLVTDIQATLEKMKEKKSEYEHDFETNVRIVKTASTELNKASDQEKIMGLQSRLAISRNKVALLKEQIENQAKRIETTDRNIKILKKLQAAAKTHVGLAQSTLDIKKDEYEQAKKMRSVIRSITSIFNSSWLTKSMEDQMALDSISNTINSSIAEFNMLLDGSNEILMNEDINNIINAEKVDEILRDLDSGSNFANLLPHKTDASDLAEYTVVDEREPEKVKVKSRYF